MLVVALAACGSAPPPQPIAHRAEPSAAPPLDQLAFLEGCWSEWSVDWGFDLCWKRDGAGWTGRSTSYGPMGKHWDVGFRIVPTARGFALTSIENTLEWWDRYRAVASASSSHAHVAFGTGTHAVAFVRRGNDLDVRVSVISDGEPYHLDWTLRPCAHCD